MIYFATVFFRDETKLLGAEKRLKEIELRVNLFNLGYSSVMYMEKLINMEVAVGGGFGALLLFKKEPIYSNNNFNRRTINDKF